MVIAIVILLIILIIFIVNINMAKWIKTRRGAGTKVEYPYEYTYTSLDTIRERMDKLTTFTFNEHNTDYKLKNVDLFEVEKYFLADDPRYYINISLPTDYGNMNNISNYFTETCRLDANMINGISVHDWWRKNCKKAKYQDVPAEELHEMIYVDGPKQLTNFKPSNLAGLIEMFGSTSVLDFSSGWGDRLAAIMAKGKQVTRYVGVDPNACLHPHYQDMITELNIHDVDIEMIQSPFETAEVSGTFDLVFTSPPYFNLEIYSKDNSQSIEHGNLQAWYDNFLMFSIKKAWDMLNMDGVLGININDFGDSRYVQNMVMDVNKFLDSKYLGIIIYSNERFSNPQPIFIWRKCKVEYPSVEFKPLVTLDDNLMDQALAGKQLGKRPLLITDALTPDIFAAYQYGLNVILKSDYNPPFVIEPLDFKRKRFHLIQDGYLTGGTKQRGMFEYMLDKLQYDEFVYAGPSEGFAQVALAYTCWRLGKSATSFTDSRSYSKQIKKAQSYGAKCLRVDGSLRDIREEAQEYVDKTPGSFMIPFGLHDDQFIELMKNNILEAIPEGFAPKRMWLVAGSGTLLKIFSQVLPNTYIIAVQVGKKIWPDQVPDNAELMIAPEKFSQMPRQYPPYKTVLNYDGKMWQFIKRYGKNGDYIFNVGMI